MKLLIVVIFVQNPTVGDPYTNNKTLTSTMKNQHLFAFLLALTLGSCNLGDQKKDEQQNDKELAIKDSIRETQEEKEATEGALAKYSDVIRKMFDQKGVVRGFDFGDPLQKVKDVEHASLTMECLDPEECEQLNLIYEVPLSQKAGEIMSIEYKFDKAKKVEGFQVDVFKPDFEEVHRDAVVYFTDQYGAPKIEVSKDTIRTWTAKDHKVILNKETSKIPSASGIKIQFVK